MAFAIITAQTKRSPTLSMEKKMTISITVFKSISDMNNNINGEVIEGETVTSIYNIINSQIAQKTDSFYAWTSSVSDGARLAPMIGAWD